MSTSNKMQKIKNVHNFINVHQNIGMLQGTDKSL